MKYLLILSLSALTFGADEKPLEISAEEKLSIRTSQLELSEAQAQLAAKQQYYEQLVEQQADMKALKDARDKAQAALNAVRSKVLSDHKCTPPCVLDEKTLNLTKPAPAAPIPAVPSRPSQ